jgi:hypothetical protein
MSCMGIRHEQEQSLFLSLTLTPMPPQSQPLSVSLLRRVAADSLLHVPASIALILPASLFASGGLSVSPALLLRLSSVLCLSSVQFFLLCSALPCSLLFSYVLFWSVITLQLALSSRAILLFVMSE